MNADKLETYRKGILRFDFLNNEQLRTAMNNKILKRIDNEILNTIKLNTLELMELSKDKEKWERETKIYVVFKKYVLELIKPSYSDIGHVRVYEF